MRPTTCAPVHELRCPAARFAAVPNDFVARFLHNGIG